MFAISDEIVKILGSECGSFKKLAKAETFNYDSIDLKDSDSSYVIASILMFVSYCIWFNPEVLLNIGITNAFSFILYRGKNKYLEICNECILVNIVDIKTLVYGFINLLIFFVNLINFIPNISILIF